MSKDLALMDMNQSPKKNGTKRNWWLQPAWYFTKTAQTEPTHLRESHMFIYGAIRYQQIN